MTTRLFTTAIAALALVATLSTPAAAQHGRRGGAVVRGRAVPVAPLPSRVIRVAPFSIRPYRYGYGPRVNLFFGYGYPYGYPYGYYGYYGWGYPYGYPYGYYPYGVYPGYYGYGYGAYGYGGYGYGGYGYGGYGYGAAYGSVRIVDAPKEAQVFVDGYYAGVVGDFDGPIHHLDLEPGAHKIEVRAPGLETSSFDVNITPGRTITYHARPRLPQP